MESKWNETFRSVMFWKGCDPGDLELKSRKLRGGHEGPGRAPHTRGPLVASLTDFFHLYISIYPENIQDTIDREFRRRKPL